MSALVLRAPQLLLFHGRVEFMILENFEWTNRCGYKRNCIGKRTGSNAYESSPSLLHRYWSWKKQQPERCTKLIRTYQLWTNQWKMVHDSFIKKQTRTMAQWICHPVSETSVVVWWIRLDLKSCSYCCCGCFFFMSQTLTTYTSYRIHTTYSSYDVTHY